MTKAPDFAYNPRAVINLRAVVPSLLFGLLLAASGCEKSNDVPRLQEDAQATAKRFGERLDDLAERAQAISARGNTLRPDAANSADAQRAYREAVTKLESSRRLLETIPAQAKAGSATPEALHKLIDNAHERLEHAVIEINANLDAVESWIAVALDQQGRQPAAPPSAAGGTVPAGAPQPTGADAAIR